MNVSSAWQRDDRHSVLMAGMMWVLIVLMIVPDGFDYQTLLTVSAPSSGGAISRILWLALLALGSVAVLGRAQLTWLLVRSVNPFLFLFAALAVASLAWSIDPSLSARRLIRLGTIVLTCLAFVSIAWHARRFQNVLRPIVTLVIVGSLGFGLAFPSLAIHSETSAELIGAWHGLANHKNGLGALSCLGLILWFHAGLTREVNILPALAGCAAAAASLVLSRSSTSLLAALVAMALLLFTLRAPASWRHYQPLFITLLVALLLLYAVALLDLIPGSATLLAPVAALTDKNETLSGRTEIWTILAEHIRNHPIFGTGYGAYWTAAPTVGTDAYGFLARMGGFYPGSAHNGYLEVVNDLGWLGFMCLLAYIATYVRQSLQLLQIERDQAALYLAIFVQQLISNQSESHWFSVLSIDFVVVTLATTALARSLLEHRLRAFFGNPYASVSASAARVESFSHAS